MTGFDGQAFWPPYYTVNLTIQTKSYRQLELSLLLCLLPVEL